MVLRRDANAAASGSNLNRGRCGRWGIKVSAPKARSSGIDTEWGLYVQSVVWVEAKKTWLDEDSDFRRGEHKIN